MDIATENKGTDVNVGDGGKSTTTSSGSETSGIELPVRLKKSRASKPKVKTGCLVCKARRVKCDETKPACLKCTSTGRHCDGYPAVKSSNGEPRPLKAIQTSYSQVVSLKKNPNVAISGSTQERRSYYYFLTNTRRGMSESLLSESFPQLMLQLSHIDPVIQSIATALGALNERLQVNHVLTSENAQANALHDFATIQYTKAVGRLHRELGRNCNQRDIEFTLVACLMFMVYDFMQGEDEQAMIHFQFGLAVLEQYVARLGLTPDNMFDPGTRPGLINVVFAMFARQASGWLAIPPIRHKVLNCYAIRQYNAPLVDIFRQVPIRRPLFDETYSDLTDAEVVLRRNLIMTLLFVQKISAEEYYVNSTEIPPEMISEHRSLLARLDRWPPAMDILLAKLPPVLELEDKYFVEVLYLHHRVVFLYLIAGLVPRKEAIYSTYTHVFEEIVSQVRVLSKSPDIAIIRKVINKHNPPGDDVSISIFVFNVGLIQPLYYAAAHCQEARVCREAIELLETRPWREGAWDSAAMARIARKRVGRMGG